MWYFGYPLGRVAPGRPRSFRVASFGAARIAAAYQGPVSSTEEADGRHVS